MKKRLAIMIALGYLITAILGCKNGPVDMPIFFTAAGGSLADVSAGQLERSLQALVGTEPVSKLVTNTSPSRLKLDAEIASGDYSILIVPEPYFQLLAKAGGLVELSDSFATGDYPEGVVEVDDGRSRGETSQSVFLFTIPIGWRYNRELLPGSGFVVLDSPE